MELVPSAVKAGAQKLTVNRQKWSLRSTLKSFKVFSADLPAWHGIPAPREFLHCKNHFPIVWKTLSLDITIPYNLLISENIAKFNKWKAETTFKTPQLILIHREGNIYVKRLD